MWKVCDYNWNFYAVHKPAPNFLESRKGHMPDDAIWLNVPESLRSCLSHAY